MAHGIIRIHHLHIAERELETTRFQLAGDFRIVAHGDVESHIRMHVLKRHDLAG